MGTHPIFESDFDCLTDRNQMAIRLAKTQKDAFTFGVRAETLANPNQNDFDSFIVFQPGIPSEDVENDQVLNHTKLGFFHYSDCSGNPLAAHVFNNNDVHSVMADEAKFKFAKKTTPFQV